MGRPAVLVLLVAISAVVAGPLNRRMLTQLRQVISLVAVGNWLAHGGSSPELLGWRMALPFRIRASERRPQVI